MIAGPPIALAKAAPLFSGWNEPVSPSEERANRLRLLQASKKDRLMPHPVDSKPAALVRAEKDKQEAQSELWKRAKKAGVAVALVAAGFFGLGAVVDAIYDDVVQTQVDKEFKGYESRYGDSYDPSGSSDPAAYQRQVESGRAKLEAEKAKRYEQVSKEIDLHDIAGKGSMGQFFGVLLGTVGHWVSLLGLLSLGASEVRPRKKDMVQWAKALKAIKQADQKRFPLTVPQAGSVQDRIVKQVDLKIQQAALALRERIQTVRKQNETVHKNFTRLTIDSGFGFQAHEMNALFATAAMLSLVEDGQKATEVHPCDVLAFKKRQLALMQLALGTSNMMDYSVQDAQSPFGMRFELNDDKARMALSESEIQVEGLTGEYQEIFEHQLVVEENLAKSAQIIEKLAFSTVNDGATAQLRETMERTAKALDAEHRALTEAVKNNQTKIDISKMTALNDALITSAANLMGQREVAQLVGSDARGLLLRRAELHKLGPQTA